MQHNQIASTFYQYFQDKIKTDNSLELSAEKDKILASCDKQAGIAIYHNVSGEEVIVLPTWGYSLETSQAN